MKKLLELISDETGRLSRTQTQVVVCLLFVMAVIVTDIIQNGTVLTVPMLISLGLLLLFCMVSRLEANIIRLSFSKKGAEIHMEDKKE